MKIRWLKYLCLTAALGAAAWAAVIGFNRWQHPVETNSTRPTRSRSAPKPLTAAEAGLEFVPSPLGTPVSELGRPMVTHMSIVDLDADGLHDVLYCEARTNTVRWIRQTSRGAFAETIIGEDIAGPAHVAAVDLNGTGRLDLLVASMGQIFPSNDHIGTVVVLENLNNVNFRKRIVIEKIPRVTDVRGANLTGHADGRLDLVVGQFGYAQGETRWLENKGDWKFESHIVNTQSGCIHTPVADFDGDGAPDFAALISQEWEEVHWFRNLGRGQFQGSIIWGSTNEDFGSSGMEVADVNRDGRPDLIYTNGDGFDYPVPGSRPWHGIQWIENKGNGFFRYHRVGELPGAYSPCAADLNGDGTTDLLAVSGYADWSDPKVVTMMAWLNDGVGRFTPVILAHEPIQLVTVAVGDLDGTGSPVIVTGGFHAVPPFDRMSNVTLWRRK